MQSNLNNQTNYGQEGPSAPPLTAEYQRPPSYAQPTYVQPEYAQNYEQQTNYQEGGYPKGGESDFDCGSGEYGNRMNFQDRTWQDLWALGVWVVAMIGMFFGIFNLYGGSQDDINVTGEGNTIFIICVLGVVGVAIGFMWMAAMKKCAAKIIRAMLYANLGLWILMTLIYFVMGLVFPAVIALILTIAFAIYVYFVRKRIDLAAAMLEIGIKIIDENTATVGLQLVTLFLQILWIIWWGAVAYAYSMTHNDEGFVFVCLIVVLYWTLQVLANISHTSICGVGAVWFFSKLTKNPTWTSFAYASTKGLGSICFGSLLVSLIQTARALVRNAQNNGRGNALVLCLLQCLLQWLESLIRFFNTYAYAQVAIYGTSFVESSKRTWSLLSQKGLDAWINDDLTGFALGCGALVGALVTALVGYVLSASFDSISSDMRIGYLVAGFVVGYFLCATVMMVVRSAVVTVFVCWAEDPDAMSHNRPQEFHMLSEQWARLYGPRH